MTKPGFWSDTFEQLAEMGQSTTKQSVKAVAKTFSPGSLLKQAMGETENNAQPVEKNKNKNSTPLDFNKLQQKYQDKDQMKTEALRNKLFQLVKSGEEKILIEDEQKKEQAKQQELYAAEEKRKKEAQKRRLEQSSGTPHGKERRNIFSPKKVAKRELAEVKPASGKQ
jgi:hypothetical protein